MTHDSLRSVRMACIDIPAFDAFHLLHHGASMGGSGLLFLSNIKVAHGLFVDATRCISEDGWVGRCASGYVRGLGVV